MANKRSNAHVPPGSTEQLEVFVNYLMERGKKSVARTILHDSFEIIKKRGYPSPNDTFLKAVSNVTPILEVKAKRVGGSVYQVPVEVNPKRQIALAYRWILGAARGKKGAGLAKKLADELISASEGMGDAVKKKDDVFRMAQANKAFAHFSRY
jgi:small subunit ribosomal protein S7